ncbi:MAG: hypothetical protein AAB250_18820, partial [Bdellovibrionota bacterium]
SNYFGGNVGIGTTAPLPGNRLEALGGAIAAGSQSSTLGGEVRIYETGVTGNNYVAFRAPANLATTTTWLMPNAEGGSGNVLSTNGAGSLTWVSAGGGGDFFRDGSVSMTGQFLAISGATGSPGIAFSYDTDTGMFNAGANSLAFSSGGTERMRIDSSGRVGVGTNAPTVRKLDVYQSSALTNPQSNIGTASIGITNSSATDDSFSEIGFSTLDSSGTQITGSKIASVYSNHAAGSITADIRFLTRDSGTFAERMRVESNGNVGIGTTTATANLDVRENTNNNGIHTVGRFSRTGGSQMGAGLGYMGNGSDAIAGVMMSVGTNTPLILARTDGSATPVEAMRI